MQFKKSVLITLAFLVFSVPAAKAKISKRQLGASESVTAGKLFMSQVDTVSLYLSTDHIVYVPRLTQDLKVRATMILLGLSFGNDQKALEEFVNRHVTVFNKTLVERLEYYTPSLAKNFKPETDVEFVVQIGPDRKPAGVWRGGNWIWGTEEGQDVTEVLETDRKICKKKCPALLKSKKTQAAEVVVPLEETPPSEVAPAEPAPVETVSPPPEEPKK